MSNLRVMMAVAVPALAALLGFLWFKRKKKPAIESNTENKSMPVQADDVPIPVPASPDLLDQVVDQVEAIDDIPVTGMPQPDIISSDSVESSLAANIAGNCNESSCNENQAVENDVEGNLENIEKSIEACIIPENADPVDLPPLSPGRTAEIPLEQSHIVATEASPQLMSLPVTSLDTSTADSNIVLAESSTDILETASHNSVSSEMDSVQTADDSVLIVGEVHMENGNAIIVSDDSDNEMGTGRENELISVSSESTDAGSDPDSVILVKDDSNKVESGTSLAGEPAVVENGDAHKVMSENGPADIPIGNGGGDATSSSVLESNNNGLKENTVENGNSEHEVPGNITLLNGGDSHSEVSSDSGKGASSISDIALPASPPTLLSALSPTFPPELQEYHFIFPQDYCGLLIGRQGRTVSQLKSKSGADIRLQRNNYFPDAQICIVSGTQPQVAAALNLIRCRFPPRQFPGLTFEQLNAPPDAAPVLTPQIMQMSLPEGVSVDVIVSSVVDVNHMFVQQPTHPSFTQLDRLGFCMNNVYGQDGMVPELPRPVEVGVICAAPMFNGWFRAQVMGTVDETDEIDIKYVDYGGYARVAASTLRQIRSDFTNLPFQSIEVYLANVIPPNGAETFPPEAFAYMQQLVQGKMLQAQILCHEMDGTPYVQLYETKPDGTTVFINREVVDQGMAQWYEMT